MFMFIFFNICIFTYFFKINIDSSDLIACTVNLKEKLVVC